MLWYWEWHCAFLINIFLQIPPAAALFILFNSSEGQGRTIQCISWETLSRRELIENTSQSSAGHTWHLIFHLNTCFTPMHQQILEIVSLGNIWRTANRYLSSKSTHDQVFNSRWDYSWLKLLPKYLNLNRGYSERSYIYNRLCSNISNLYFETRYYCFGKKCFYLLFQLFCQSQNI